MTSSRTPSSPVPAVRGAWSDAAVEALTALWRDPDLSAALIAKRLGVTRNAVLGKVHRLGLSKPRAPKPPPCPLPPASAHRPVARKGVGLRRRLASAPRVREAPVPGAGPPLVARLEDLPRRACHWPIGDPQAPGFGFCGRRGAKGPYCAAHAAVAYRGPGLDAAELARLLRR